MDASQLDDEQLERLARASSLALGPAEYADVPAEAYARLRSLCMALPEAEENPAWAGWQWRVRKRTFAHLLAVDFAKGPLTVVTFRSSGPELDALRSAGLPFFHPAWGIGAVGLVLDGDHSGGPDPGQVDGDEVAELVTESYRLQAPRKLITLLDRSSGQDPSAPGHRSGRRAPGRG